MIKLRGTNRPFIAVKQYQSRLEDGRFIVLYLNHEGMYVVHSYNEADGSFTLGNYCRDFNSAWEKFQERGFNYCRFATKENNS